MFCCARLEFTKQIAVRKLLAAQPQFSFFLFLLNLGCKIVLALYRFLRCMLEFLSQCVSGAPSHAPGFHCNFSNNCNLL